MNRNVRLSLIPALILMAGIMGCEEEEEPFPDQIPGIVASLGTFYNSIIARDEAGLNRVCSDRELYADLVYVLGRDSLAVVSRRIKNPIDSAHVTLTFSAIVPEADTSSGLYELELFMQRREEIFWIVAHKLTRFRP